MESDERHVETILTGWRRSGAPELTATRQDALRPNARPVSGILDDAFSISLPIRGPADPNRR